MRRRVWLFIFNASFDLTSHNDDLLGFRCDIPSLWFPKPNVCFSVSLITFFLFSLVSLYAFFKTFDYHCDSCIQTTCFLQGLMLSFFDSPVVVVHSFKTSLSKVRLLIYIFLVSVSIYALALSSLSSLSSSTPSGPRGNSYDLNY